MSARKLVLAVIDGLKPAALERAIESGKAPVLERIMREGVYVDDCVAAFPSVTPVCAGTIATGQYQDGHRIPAMNWYHRGERRYVEYGSSFPASRRFGIGRQLLDTIYNMNLAHLSQETPTIFELLDDADVRTAGTTYLMYRGRHRHEAAGESALARFVTTTVLRHAVYGPRELFYADIFASQPTGCRSQLGLPGVRDRHAGCVGAHLVERDLFDFMLLSLPDNDTYSHKYGPDAQVVSIAEADRQMERVMHAGGGPEAFLDEHAVIVMADHSHSAVTHAVDLGQAFTGWRVLQPLDRGPAGAEIALCPSQRSAQVYVLDLDDRERIVRRAERVLLELAGVDLVMRLAGGEAIMRSKRGELRFAPDGEVADVAGRRWSVEGDLPVLGARVDDGLLHTPDYPDALARSWAALTCATSGDLLVSAVPGHEFLDWGGADHVGGGSHGSLHRGDSHGALLWCGTGPDTRDARPQWTLRDIAPMVLEHFGVAAPVPG